MKAYLVLAACVALVGCDREEQSNREVLNKMDAPKSELATQQRDSVRWAFANKRAIDSAVFEWSRERMEQGKKSEVLPPETEQKIGEFEALQYQVALAGVVNHHSPQATQYQRVFPAESLIAEYAKRRFDLVVDSSDERMFRSAALYRTNGEVPDITDGVIKRFREKAKP